MSGIIGTKIGMTRIFDDRGEVVPVTAIKAGPCFVTQIKNEEKEGYCAVQLAYGEKKEKNTTKALLGHFKKANITQKKTVIEFRDFIEGYEGNVALGQEIKVEDVFKEGDWVDVVGKSKGRGFQGVVKRHGFSGVGGQTHGQHNRLRAPGSIGSASFPSRVFKGRKMAGRMGNKQVKILNLYVVKIMASDQLLLVKGAVPGPKNATLIIKK